MENVGHQPGALACGFPISFSPHHGCLAAPTGHLGFDSIPRRTLPCPEQETLSTIQVPAWPIWDASLSFCQKNVWLRPPCCCCCNGLKDRHTLSSMERESPGKSHTNAGNHRHPSLLDAKKRETAALTGLPSEPPWGRPWCTFSAAAARRDIT